MKLYTVFCFKNVNMPNTNKRLRYVSSEENTLSEDEGFDYYMERNRKKCFSTDSENETNKVSKSPDIFKGINVCNSESEDNSDYTYSRRNNYRYDDKNKRNFNLNKLRSNHRQLKKEIENSSQQKRRNPTRKPTCNSKNALMARENRLKKKMYVENLEGKIDALNENNKDLKKVINRQEFLIRSLRKEVKYLKSVLANSNDILKVLKSINASTGFPVASSVKNEFTKPLVFTKPEPIENTLNIISEDFDFGNDFNFDGNSSFLNEIFPELSDCLPDSFNFLSDIPDFAKEDYRKSSESSGISLDDHSYSVKDEVSVKEDVGICLHISKQRVSLEFCAICAENSTNTWDKLYQEEI